LRAPGDILGEAALFRFGETLQTNRDALLLYADEDAIERRGRRRQPWFKPRWNAEMFYAQDYLSSALAMETSLA
jgi:hypothetical protein